MDSLSPHILMTASDPMQDLALQMLLKPYNLRLTFCPFDIDEIITRLEGIQCGMKATSCPDQLAQALKEAKNA